MFITPTTPTVSTSSSSRMRWWLGGFVVIIAGVGIIIWLRQRPATPFSPIARPDTREESPLRRVTDPSLQPVPASEPPADADGDGVSDDVERKNGTNLNQPDTDADGFTDAEELFFRKTNPLQADPPPAYPGFFLEAAPAPVL